MAGKNTNKQSGQTKAAETAAESPFIQLRDQETSFRDPETGLSIVRDQVVELGSKKGRLTAAALVGGALIRVPAPKEKEA